MNPRRLLICSLPKSGTHLLASLVIDKFQLNQPIYFIHHCVDTNSYSISAERNGFGGNRDEWLNFQPNLPYAYYSSHTFSDCELLLSTVREGEIALSHFSRRNIPFILDSSFDYVVLLRQIESIISSAFNAELKIAREKPHLLDLKFSHINFINPTRDDFNSFIKIYREELIPLAIDFVYWNNISNAYIVWYDDLVTSDHVKSQTLSHIEKIILPNNDLYQKRRISSKEKSQTYVEDNFKILTPDIVSDLLGKDDLIDKLNQILFSLSRSKASK